MATKDHRVDAYVANAKPFARPILKKLRNLIFKACPEAVETLKWGMPSYDYHGILCGMAAFKEHAVFGFWKHALMEKMVAQAVERKDRAMGIMGKIRTVSDLPSDAVMLRLIKAAMKLNEKGISVPRRPVEGKKRALDVPESFMRSLKKNKAALATFESFSYTKKKDYVEWIVGAKREDTRQRRLEIAIEWLSAGKTLNWRYEIKKKK